MRILLISTGAVPTPPLNAYGGIEWIVYWLAKALSRQGHDVAIMGLQGTIPPDDKVKVYIALTEQEKYAEVLYRDRISKVVEDFKPELVNDHSHTKATFDYFREKNIPFIPSSHTIGIPDLKVPNVCWTALSKSHAKWLRQHYGIEARVCYNGIDVEEDIKPIIDYKNKTGPLLFLGRPNPEKGALDVIDFCIKHNMPLDVVAGRLEVEQIGYALLVAQACKEYSQQKYHGAVDYKTKFKFYSEAKALFFMPNWPEPFGLTPIEANWVGTPVITNDMGAMPELVENGKTGFIIPTRKENGEPIYEFNRYGFKRVVWDEDEVLSAIDKLPTLNLDYIAKRTKDKFNIDNMARQYLHVYENYIRGDRW
jgi:glycosyltransferase involved in cell wall biosynthesis